MSRLAQIFGYDKRKAWWYRDLALTTIAAIMVTWVIIALVGPQSSFNWRLGIGAAAVATLCWAITPNKLMLFMVVAGFVAVQGWFAVLFSHDTRSWWIAVPASILDLVFFLKYRNKPMIRR